MKRYGALWQKLVSWENLVLAARKARRGKRSRVSVQAFSFAEEDQLLRIQRELETGTFRPGEFRTHWVKHPKPRLISAAPYRDRVMHHALMNLLEPILDRHFHPDSYACREGKGAHAAADRLQKHMRCNRYALQCDVRKFFPSIDHEILKGTFRRLIKDRRVLWLMDLIVDSSNEQPGSARWFPGDDLLTPLERRRGLPIGNLTSQWFANWMLNDLDHFVTSGLGIGAYVRYCDDFILLDDNRGLLKEAMEKIRARLAEARLDLHERKAFVRPVRCGLTFVGYRIWPTHRLLRKDNVRRLRRRVRWMRQAYADGRIDWEDVKPRLASWLGHARHADSKRLVRRVSREWRFSRGGAERQSCSPRRRMEQQCIERGGRLPQHEHADESEQQQRLPTRPALSADREDQARNRTVHERCERGLESPGPVPVPIGSVGGADGRTCAVGPGGSGRRMAERPTRSRCLVTGRITSRADSSRSRRGQVV